MNRVFANNAINMEISQMVTRLLRTPMLFAMALMMTIITLPSQAADLPSYYPKTFEWLGTINELNLRGNVIIIRDAEFKLADKVMVATPQTRHSTLHALRPGQQVGCTFETTPLGEKAINGIWVFPKTSKGLLLPPPDL